MTQLTLFDELPSIPVDPSGTVIFLLKRSRLGETRSLSSLLELDASIKDSVRKDLLSMVGRIYASPELKAIEKLDARDTAWIGKRALPSILRTEATWVLPVPFIPETDAHFTESADLRARLVLALTSVFDDRVAGVKAELGPAADKFRWLTARDLGPRFTLTWRYYTIGLPPALAFDPLLNEREKARMLADLTAQQDLILTTLRTSALALFARLEANLEPNDKGRPKRFYDAALDDVREFLRMLPVRGAYVPDQALTVLADTARQMLSGVDAETIRKSPDVTEYVRTRTTALLDTFTSATDLVRPARKISLTDELEPLETF